MSCRSVLRSLPLARRLVAAVMIGVVILLGLSACLTRGGVEVASSGATIVATMPSSPDATAKPALRRCAFSLLAALPDRREIGDPTATAGSIPTWRLADATAPEEWRDRVPERPPRAAALA